MAEQEYSLEKYEIMNIRNTLFQVSCYVHNHQTEKSLFLSLMYVYIYMCVCVRERESKPFW